MRTIEEVFGLPGKDVLDLKFLSHCRLVVAAILPHEKNSSQGWAASRRSLQGALLAEAKFDVYGDLGAKAFLSVLVAVSG